MPETARAAAKDQRKELASMDPFIIVEYTKALLEVVMEARAVEESRENGGETVQEYEVIIQKLEAEIRSHVRVEQQLKLYVETLQFKLDEIQTQLQQYTDKNKELEETLTKLRENAKAKEKILSLKQKSNGNFGSIFIGGKSQLKPLVRKKVT
eukprot:TRINITY_DN927_c0_g1_i3.p1 TRINITY_DN927_c0_g1~~TRINITY_DN927_c0_g1_i3.p1  ORF type:complete len:153 (+),score=53.98 TRINITY_DN927_c0_g1_i3:259-717(+)